jgi:hypothetical protein
VWLKLKIKIITMVVVGYVENRNSGFSGVIGLIV